LIIVAAAEMHFQKTEATFGSELVVIVQSQCGVLSYFDDLGWRFAPHSRQNFELTGMRVWHLGQISSTGLGCGA